MEAHGIGRNTEPMLLRIMQQECMVPVFACREFTAGDVFLLFRLSTRDRDIGTPIMLVLQYTFEHIRHFRA